MSRHSQYQKMLNSKRWKVTRANYLRAHPLCELCLRNGKYVSAVDVHHIVPVESARTIREMESLCFNANGTNLMALCPDCHYKLHRHEGSHTRAAHKQREADRLQQWINKIKGKCLLFTNWMTLHFLKTLPKPIKPPRLV